jgi:hypothetical protein
MTGYPMSWGGTGQFQPQAYSGDIPGQIGQPFGGQLGWIVGQLGRILASNAGIGGGVQQYGGQPFGVGQQPFGVGQQPFGAGQQPVGVGQQPVGMGQQPFGGQQPVGMGQQPFGGQQQYQPQDVSNVVGPIAAAIAPVISALIARAQTGGMQGYGMQGLQQFQPQGQIPQFGGQIHPQVAAVLQLLGAAVTQAQQAQQAQAQGMQVPGQRQFAGV